MLTLANLSLIKLRLISVFSINKSGLDDTFLGVGEISIAKEILLMKDKNMVWLFLSLLKANKMYFLRASIPN